MRRLKTGRLIHTNKKAISYFLALFSLILSVNAHAAPIRVSTGQGLNHQAYTTGIMNVHLNNSDGLLFLAAGHGSGFTDKFNYVSSDFFTTAQISPAPTPSPIRVDDIIITGDFLGSGQDQILAANPDNSYRLLTLRIGNTYENAFARANGNIDVNDRLFNGDFTGNGRDEVLLIKADGSYHTMQYNTIEPQETTLMMVISIYLNRALLPCIGGIYHPMTNTILVILMVTAKMT